MTPDSECGIGNAGTRASSAPMVGTNYFPTSSGNRAHGGLCTLKCDYLIFFVLEDVRRASQPGAYIQNSVRFIEYHVKLHNEIQFIICSASNTVREAFFTPTSLKKH